MTRIALVGEAYGEQEEKEGRPFVGSSGFILNGMLSQIGLPRDECFITNVFNLRPKPSNDIKNLCGPKESAVRGFPMLGKGMYIREEFTHEIERLYAELRAAQPTVIVAFGATAAWALCGTNGIKHIRGAAIPSRLGIKVFPTYHPAAVARDYTLRPIVVADLCKVLVESQYPDLRRPSRDIWIEPDLDDLQRFEDEHIISAERLSVDIETAGERITCIGFAPSTTTAIVIPLLDNQKREYWKSPHDEARVLQYIQRWLRMKPSTFQNGLYDINFMWSRYGIEVPLAQDDTMLLHHALQPEMEKGLGFLGSIYTSEPPWKFMRKKHETAKKEDL